MSKIHNLELKKDIESIINIREKDDMYTEV